jgi:hypothetical protein
VSIWVGVTGFARKRELDEPQRYKVNPQVMPNRVAFSPAEFSRLFGRHPSWGYRLLYKGKVKAVTDLGRVLIPATEVDRLLKTAGRYDPQPTDKEEGA